MNCQNCGGALTPDCAFCGHCGGAVKRSQTVNNNTTARTPNGCVQKSKLVAGLLGILVGVYGVHNFYLGFTNKAIMQLLLGTVGMIFIFGPVVSSIWGLIEGIYYLTGQPPYNVDANGVPLTDEFKI